jgi:Zn-dependent oligopeptidase
MTNEERVAKHIQTMAGSVAELMQEVGDAEALYRRAETLAKQYKSQENFAHDAWVKAKKNLEEAIDQGVRLAQVSATRRIAVVAGDSNLSSAARAVQDGLKDVICAD